MKQKKTLEDVVKDPVMMKSVIDTILDPKHPDISRIKKEIIKNISNCIQKDSTFISSLKSLIIEKADDITRDMVKQCLDESKEYLTNALVATVNMECQTYFNEQKRIVLNVIKKTLDSCVKDIINSAKQFSDKNQKKIQQSINTNYANLTVPSKHRKQIEDYAKFLSSQEISGF